MKVKKPVGIIGFGNMGAALAGRLEGIYPLIVFDQDKGKTRLVKAANKAKSPQDLLLKTEVIILAVKPQDFAPLLKKIKGLAKGKLIISIAAGIPTGYIERRLGMAKVIRVMPNLPAKIGKGMSCLCSGRLATTKDLNFAKNIFSCLGCTLIIKETMLDAATAVSGSGPGYFYHYLESRKITGKIPAALIKDFKIALQKAAEAVGFKKTQAIILSEVTLRGSLAMFKVSKLKAAELKQQVVSRGGTTEAGLKVLSKGGSLNEAVKAALKRAKELAKK
ncbi:MAG: pyrroline-5-carboxylate reductase [Candidatus Omnitrophica bacterium]|nr:pyrroline-5-carboxylate reductase [Candidatus Omnitrophota bacterium]